MQITMDLISDILVFLLLGGDLLRGCFLIGLNLGDHFLLLYNDLAKVSLPFIHHDVHLVAHLDD